VPSPPLCSLAFGPGLLDQVLYGVEQPLLIQARDTFNERRTSGGDKFQIRAVSSDGKTEGVAQYADNGDGSYSAGYMVPGPGGCKPQPPSGNARGRGARAVSCPAGSQSARADAQLWAFAQPPAARACCAR